MSSSDAAKALEPKLAEIATCVDGVTPGVDDSYRVAMDIDGSGKVTAVRAVESKVPEAAAKCADDALLAATLPALSKADATLTLTVTIKMKRTAEVVAEAKEAEKAAEPLPPTTPTNDAASGSNAMASDASSGNKASADSPGSAQGATLQATTTAETKPEEPTKLWKVTANVTQWIGQGTFVKESFAATPDYGYLAALGASYKVHEKVSIGTRVVWLQQLTTTNKDTGTVPREALFRDLTLSASAPKLYKEENTGIDFGGGATLYFPISKASRAQQRIFGTGIRGSANRTFEKLGPGDLTAGWSVSFVKNFGPAAPDNDPGKHPTGELCRGGNRDGASGSCLASNATNSYFVLNDFTVAYTFLEDWTFTVDFLIWNQVSNRLGDSAGSSPDLAAGNNVVVGMSPFATARTTQNDLTVSTIELAYAINKHFTVAASLYTFQPVFIQDGSNSHALRFPFWDFRSASENYSSFNLDVAFTY